MKKIIGIILILFTLVLAGCSNSPTGNTVEELASHEQVKLTGEIKEFTVEAFQFGFEPSVIEVNEGDIVRITASSRDVPHSFTLYEFGVNLYLDGLNTQTAEFVADKKGTFKFFCSVPCGRGHSKMAGKFIVN